MKTKSAAEKEDDDEEMEDEDEEIEEEEENLEGSHNDENQKRDLSDSDTVPDSLAGDVPSAQSVCIY